MCIISSLETKTSIQTVDNGLLTGAGVQILVQLPSICRYHDIIGNKHKMVRFKLVLFRTVSRASSQVSSCLPYPFWTTLATRSALKKCI